MATNKSSESLMPFELPEFITSSGLLHWITMIGFALLIIVALWKLCSFLFANSQPKDQFEGVTVLLADIPNKRLDLIDLTELGRVERIQHAFRTGSLDQVGYDEVAIVWIDAGSNFSYRFADRQCGLARISFACNADFSGVVIDAVDILHRPKPGYGRDFYFNNRGSFAHHLQEAVAS